ncbi:MAG: aminoacyl-tRNA hydrolase [Gammaproteobacteria bacterium]
MPAPIDLIVGLGNPGSEYADTRHNAGFWFVDALTRRHAVLLRTQRAFFGELGRVTIDGHGCWLLKPMTYMNRSGQAAVALASYYRIASEQVLVVHDELDLDPGVVRLKRGGGPGGHQGLKDLLARLGEPSFLRLRIGIGRSAPGSDATPYVLGRPPAAEREAIRGAIDAAIAELPRLLAGDLAQAMNQLHRRTREPI